MIKPLTSSTSSQLTQLAQPGSAYGSKLRAESVVSSIKNGNELSVCVDLGMVRGLALSAKVLVLNSYDHPSLEKLM